MDKISKIIVVGCGGIGSHFVTNLVNEVIREQIVFDTLEIWDEDKIELKNGLYTTYVCDPETLGQFKVNVLKKELDFSLSFSDKKLDIIANPVNYKIEDFRSISRNTIFVSTVDGSKFRAGLLKNTDIGTLGNRNSSWIDIRSTRARFILFRSPVSIKEQETLFPYFEDVKIENASCQLASDLISKKVQYGNRIAAIAGIQYIINLSRGKQNKLIYEADFTGK